MKVIREIEVFILLSHLPYKMVFEELGSEILQQIVSMVIDDFQLPINNNVEYDKKELFKMVNKYPIVNFLTRKVFESLNKIRNWDREYKLTEIVVDDNFIIIRLKE